MLPFDPDKMLAEAMQKAQDCFTVGDLDYGREILEQILRCDPDHQAAVQLLGVLHWKSRNYQQAIPYFERAIKLDPTNPDNYNNLALCETSLGEVSKAITLIRDAIAIDPTNPKYHNNLAIQYRQMKDYTSALKVLENTVHNEVPIWINLAGLYGETHRLNEAEAALQRALSINPDNANAHVDLAYVRALKGDFKGAWSEYEYRFNHFENLWFYNNKYNPDKRWRDPLLDLDNKTLLLYCEQGLGDAIHFIRYVPMVKERFGCKIILHCSPTLESLFHLQENLFIDEFITEDIVSIDPITIPYHDHHASVMSLPYLLDLDEIPGDPYLNAPGAASFNDPNFKIGICWAGSPMHPHDAIRSCPLKHFQSLNLPGVSLYSLQQNISPRVYANLPGKPVDFTEGVEGITLLDLKEYMTDFESTAKLLTDLDLVVTVDTALMHLAGAMGKQTIGLLAYNPDWRWGLEGSTTPWYPSLTLLRQEKLGDWSAVFDDLVREVKAKL